MKSSLIMCNKCGKPIIGRKENGLWHFLFGKIPGSNIPVIEMVIHGSIRMKCIHKSCGHINILNFFPEPVFKSSVAPVRIESTQNGVEKSPVNNVS